MKFFSDILIQRGMLEAICVMSALDSQADSLAKK